MWASCAGISGELQSSSLPSRTCASRPAPNDQPLLLHWRNCPDIVWCWPGAHAQRCHAAGWRASTGQLWSFSVSSLFIKILFLQCRALLLLLLMGFFGFVEYYVQWGKKKCVMKNLFWQATVSRIVQCVVPVFQLLLLVECSVIGMCNLFNWNMLSFGKSALNVMPLSLPT